MITWELWALPKVISGTDLRHSNALKCPKGNSELSEFSQFYMVFVETVGFLSQHGQSAKIFKVFYKIP